MRTAITPQYSHVYRLRYRCWDHCQPFGHAGSCYEVLGFPVTRVTAKRIYFWESHHRDHPRHPDYGCEHFVNRADIGPTGEVWHRAVCSRLFLAPPPLPDLQRVDGQKSVAELRREAADLHPDRGGDPAAFRAAHARYLSARAVADV